MNTWHPRVALLALFSVGLASSCGKKASDTSTAEADRSLESQSATAETASAAAPVETPGGKTSTPLTVADVERWERGLAGEMKAVQDASARMKASRTGEDSLNAMMGVQEMTTASAGAQAAGVDEERYKFIRTTLSAVVSYLTPPELEGMDTTRMPQNLRDEFRNGRESQLQRMIDVVPQDVIDVLKPRAAELRKKDMELVGARLKGAGA